MELDYNFNHLLLLYREIQLVKHFITFIYLCVFICICHYPKVSEDSL